MNFFSIKLSLESSGNQTMIIDQIKNAGGDCIQVSDGLVAKSTLSLSELQRVLSEGTQGLSLSILDTQDPQLSKDAKAFAGID